MNIGFDAKRAFHNTTGLGNYSRTLIQLLAKNYPEHEYFLFTPTTASNFKITGKNMHQVLPTKFLHQLFSSVWRSKWMTQDLRKHKIDLYHGLSHEIPLGINKTKVKSVVTIHDLIHERFPEQYNPIDVKIYKKKFRYACNNADKIIAISEQTKKDIIEFYKIPEDKITVCVQSCNPAYAKQITETEKQRIAEKYELPKAFFLSVGSIIERKNLLNLCKAMLLLKKDLTIPLVVIGDGGSYKQKVKDFVKTNGMQEQIIFLSEKIKKDEDFLRPETFAAIYQSSLAMIYPSFFEGFGLPVAEALLSQVPVITSNVSCLPEAGGDAAYYVDPNSPEEMAAGMRKIYSDKEFVSTMKENGLKHASKNSPEIYTDNMMKIYKSIC